MKITIEKTDLDNLVLEAFSEGALIHDTLWNEKGDKLGTANQVKITKAFFEESDVIKKLKGK